MPGFLDILLGTEPTTETEQLDVRTEQQKESLSGLLDTLGQRQTQPGISGPSAAETTSLAGLEQLALGLVGGEDPNAAIRQEGTQVLSDIFSRGPGDVDAEFKASVQDPLLRSFETDILPGISRSFGGNRFFTSDRERAETSARESLFRTLASERGRFAREDVQTKLAGVGAIGDVRDTSAERLLALFGGISGAGGDVRRAEIERTGGESIITSDLLKAINTDVFENVVTQTPGTTGLLQAAVSGASRAAVGGAF